MASKSTSKTASKSKATSKTTPVVNDDVNNIIPEVKSEVKSEVKPEVKPDVKQEIKQDTNTDNKLLLSKDFKANNVNFGNIYTDQYDNRSIKTTYNNIEMFHVRIQRDVSCMFLSAEVRHDSSRNNVTCAKSNLVLRCVYS